MKDTDGRFLATYGAGSVQLVRPDGHVGWRGTLAASTGLPAHLTRIRGSTASPT